MFTTPLIAAPMAGGTTTTELALAAQDAGAFAFAAGGYKTADQLAAHIAPLRSAGIDFGVNLFVPRTAPLTSVQLIELSEYRTKLRTTAGLYGAAVPEELLAEDDPRVQDYWAQKIALLLADPVALVSFTFGLAPADVVEQLHKVGTQVLASVTSVAEAVAAAKSGADALVVQHANAGGHSAAFITATGTPPVAGAVEASRSGSSGNGSSMKPATLPQLISEVRSEVVLPLVGAGGISTPEDVKAVLAAGAESAAIGTALIRTNESGARLLHKNALGDPSYTDTAITRAFTGKPARALINDFVRDYTDAAPHAYPDVHFATAPLRAAAAAQNNPRALNLWAGSGWKSARTGPAAAVIAGFLQFL
ncbi:nitronate monooxygenase [Arthrobacter antibioticus]|uniref:nitronate monooxygenase n=1 Tax=Arthrobacter sp. H35-MC1 TaxID=3046203 RepID=UPI0024BA0C71|nr:nitronate monooxygenase [Arthrobacter sp. H35-MC1]MDJ0317654.1 nitronate monooxygenase [Arthrobacter sp. H35-MC1]